MLCSFKLKNIWLVALLPLQENSVKTKLKLSQCKHSWIYQGHTERATWVLSSQRHLIHLHLANQNYTRWTVCFSSCTHWCRMLGSATVLDALAVPHIHCATILLWLWEWNEHHILVPQWCNLHLCCSLHLWRKEQPWLWQMLALHVEFLFSTSPLANDGHLLSFPTWCKTSLSSGMIINLFPLQINIVESIKIIFHSMVGAKTTGIND